MEEALVGVLDRFDASSTRERFRALRDGEVVAEEDNLDQLAAKLREMQIDPRSVRILSSEYLSPIARAGFRGRES